MSAAVLAAPGGWRAEGSRCREGRGGGKVDYFRRGWGCGFGFALALAGGDGGPVGSLMLSVSGRMGCGVGGGKQRTRFMPGPTIPRPLTTFPIMATRL